MSKLYRSLLWSGLVVAGVAACGDDVTVAPPPNQGVQSVTVGPTGVTIAVGQTLQMAAAVLAAIPVIVIFFSFQRYFLRGVTVGALKG